MKKGASRGALGVLLAVRLRSGSGRLPGALGKASERLGIADGDVREDLAVHLDLGEAKAVHELAVGQPLATRRGIDAGDPEAAEVALLVAAGAVGGAVGPLEGPPWAPVTRGSPAPGSPWGPGSGPAALSGGE